MRLVPALAAGLLSALSLSAADPGALEVRFHLTARPWQPLNDTRADLLDQLEPTVRAIATLQVYDAAKPDDVANGAIRDPFNKAEVQYSTPYFAFAAATLLVHDRAPELAPAAARAMDRATRDISDGKATDNHGEFFVAPMMKAYRLFTTLQTRFPDEITDARLALWRERLSLPRARFMNLGVKQNWRTYASKGEWLRQQDGFITDGVDWIEGNWLRAPEGGQRERFTRAESLGYSPALNLYHDDTGTPETFAYNAGAAGNLLDMLEHGYEGPSAPEMRELVTRDLTTGLLLMGGSGEAPTGGRTGDHVWNDVVFGNNYDLLAEIAARKGDSWRAGQFRRAARLAFRSAWRFRQEAGWMSVTKNLFDPSLKIHYARYSALGNYNGYVQIHTAEALANRRTEIAEQPTPAEIGGYALTLPDSYANTFLNAGGMQLQLCTRGQTDNYAGVQWSTLGIVRFSRPGWDSRLGPASGATASDFSNGASFAPVFFENGSWTRVGQSPKRYAGRFTPEFVHPLLVRGTLTLAPRDGQTGPTFTQRITLTPDGALIDTARTSGDEPFGVVWPLLEFDGRTQLARETTDHLATTAYPGPAADQQSFLALRAGHRLDASAPLMRSAHGDLRPLRVTDADGGAVETFVYPRSSSDPSAEAVGAGFVRNGDDFASPLGRVRGTLYIGRTSAGGRGDRIDLDADGAPDLVFSAPCDFVLQLADGRVTTIETNRAVAAKLGGRALSLAAHTPITVAAQAAPDSKAGKIRASRASRLR